MIDGMNEHGLTATYNLALTTDVPSNHAPLSIALQEMLETCKTTDEAVEFLTHAKRGEHDALLMLADHEGNIRTVEITSNYAATREMNNGQLINTNHYHTTEMQIHEIPHNATVFERGATVRLHESSEFRYARAQELLQNKIDMDESTITTILHDHGKEGKPSDLTICRHSERSSTLRSVIFYPNRRIIKVLYGNPCQSEHAEFRFS